MSGTGHYVNGRDAAALCTLEARGPDVERIEDPCIRLDRAGAVGSRSPADVAVRINKARHDRFAGHIVDHGPCGDLDAAADGDYLAIAKNYGAALDRLAETPPGAALLKTARPLTVLHGIEADEARQSNTRRHLAESLRALGEPGDEAV